MAKKFRIVRRKGAVWYKWRIEQRHTILFFIHWWDTPLFEPPHYFERYIDACGAIFGHYKDAEIIDVGKIIKE